MTLIAHTDFSFRCVAFLTVAKAPVPSTSPITYSLEQSSFILRAIAGEGRQGEWGGGGGAGLRVA